MEKMIFKTMVAEGFPLYFQVPNVIFSWKFDKIWDGSRLGVVNMGLSSSKFCKPVWGMAKTTAIYLFVYLANLI